MMVLRCGVAGIGFVNEKNENDSKRIKANNCHFLSINVRLF